MVKEQKTRFFVRIARVKPWQVTLFFFLFAFVYGLVFYGYQNMPIVQFAMRLGVVHRVPYFAVSFVEKTQTIEAIAPLTVLMPHESWKAWDL